MLTYYEKPAINRLCSFANLVYVTETYFKRIRKDLTLGQKLDNIKCVEGGTKNSAVAIANCVSRPTAIKIVLNKRNRLEAVMVLWTDDYAYVNGRERSPHPPR